MASPSTSSSAALPARRLELAMPNTNKTAGITANENINYLITHIRMREIMEGWWEIARMTRLCSTN
jgi:hypothetical protein